MNFNSKRTVTDEQNERHKRLLANILKEEGNKSCADCKTRNPTWASVNLGVFVCLTCSGIHRSLGVHISQVRSCNLDTWLPKQVEFCRVMGNVKGNRYWEARLPKDFRRPPSGNPNPELSAFIRAKYVDRAFAATDAPPPTIDNYLNHPYGADAADSVHSPPAAPAAASQAPGPAAAPRTAAPDLLNAGTSIKPTHPPTTLTGDLLGGFDDLINVAAISTSPLPLAPASSDPFGSFVSAPPPPASNSHINSLEWTDFYAAAPVSSSSPALTSLLHPLGPTVVAAAAAAAPLKQLSVTAAAAVVGGGHQRSHSISEGVNLSVVDGSSSNQTSRFAAHSKTLSSTQPERSEPYCAHHHYRPHSLQKHNHHNHANGNNNSHGHVGQNGAAATYDPFGPPPDDLLAGLTIHHVMESMAMAPAASGGGGAPSAAAATDDPFQFSSSATAPGDGKALARSNSQHKRHPSASKASEEVLRLFDTESSTGAALSSCSGGGGGASAVVGSTAVMMTAYPSSDNPLGDFIGVGTPLHSMVTAQNCSAGSGGGGFHGQQVQQDLLMQQQKNQQQQKQQLLLGTHVALSRVVGSPL